MSNCGAERASRERQGKPDPFHAGRNKPPTPARGRGGQGGRGAAPWAGSPANVRPQAFLKERRRRQPASLDLPDVAPGLLVLLLPVAPAWLLEGDCWLREVRQVLKSSENFS